MTKVNIGSLLTYPVFRLGDSKLSRNLRRAHQLTLRILKISAFVAPVIFVAYLVIGFYLPVKIGFETSTLSCAHVPTVLPRLLSYAPTENYTVTTPSKLSINGYPLLATQMCVVPTAIPSASPVDVQVRQLKLPIGKKLTVLNNASLSASPLVKDDKVSTKANMIFELSKADLFFDYRLVVDNKSVDCLVQDSTVVCPTNDLKLKQGQPYTFVLKQTLGRSSHSLYSDDLTTITSVDLVTSSVAEAQVVYDTPQTVSATFSKPLIRANGITLSQNGTNLPITYTVADTVVTVSWETPLPREQVFLLTIDSLLANDGGYLEKPIVISFTTSGGPKVVSSTLDSSQTSQFPDFTLTFDSPLKADQNFSSLVSITSAGQSIPISLSADGNSLRVRAQSAIGSCTEYSVNISEALTSVYGIAGGNAYSMASRTRCARLFSIGKSVEGRDITAYAFGSGASTVLYLGSIHGNEKSSYYLLSSWIDYLESNPGAVPANRTVVIIPKLNPDGFTYGSRFNANNVDLNRNFASASWKTDVIVPGGSTLAGGGGSAPLSEPESRALVDYINSVGPSLVMSYHSQGSIVIANGAGNSNALASMYAQHVQYQHVATEDSGGAFAHETTGALEDWLYETTGTPTVLLELSSHGASNLFPYHRQPMLTVLN